VNPGIDFATEDFFIKLLAREFNLDAYW